jgi:glycosyltransferase involved in cell wall biosynthesis
MLKQTHMSLISIITPTYNRADLLQATIESILKQEYQNWEHIIIDDGSTDNTHAAIEHYLSDNRILFIRRRNEGAAAARNYGVSIAKGDMVTFLDSDDEALPFWLHKATELIDENVGLISLGALRCFADGRVVEEKPFPVKISGEVYHCKFTCGSLFFRKNIYESIGGYDETISSGLQTELGLRLLTETIKRDRKIRYSNVYAMKINIHNGPRMRSDWNTLVNDTSLFINKLYDFYYVNDKKELSNNFAALAYYSYKAGKGKKAIASISKAIKLRPFQVVNYLRAVKYMFPK